MRLRTFHASDMQKAMQQIRDELGEAAVIVSTTRDKSSKRVSVTAAIDQAEVKFAAQAAPAKPAPQAHPAMQTAEPEVKLARSNAMINGLAKIMEFHSIPKELQERLLDTAEMLEVPPDGGDDALAKLLAKVLDAHFCFLPLPISRAGFRLMLIGPTGAGKTTTLAKIAAQLTMDKQPVTAISFDTKRAGGIEQFRAFTDILNIPLEVAESPAELQEIMDEQPPGQIVLIDSFGCNTYDGGDLKALKPYLQVEGVEPVLTLPAGGDTYEAAELGKAFQPTGAKRLLATRCDISRRFGGLLNAAYGGDYAFCNYSSSDRVVGEYGPLGTKTLSNLLMEYRK
jgi:flagellar biosynthesis protein FlhF